MVAGIIILLLFLFVVFYCLAELGDPARQCPRCQGWHTRLAPERVATGYICKDCEIIFLPND